MQGKLGRISIAVQVPGTTGNFDSENIFSLREGNVSTLEIGAHVNVLPPRCHVSLREIDIKELVASQCPERTTSRGAM
jgi:hypothetical protein